MGVEKLTLPIGKSRSGWTNKIRMVAVNSRTAVTFTLPHGQAGDAPEGRKLLKELEDKGWEGAQVIMEKAYDSDETRQLVFDLGMTPVVPPKSNRVTSCEYDEEMYKKRNEV